MIKAAIAIGVVAAILAAVFMWPSKTVYVNPEVVEKEVIKEVDPLQSQIENREKELEDLYRKAQNLEASLDVREAEIKRLEALNVEDRKQLASFIQAIASKK